MTLQQFENLRTLGLDATNYIIGELQICDRIVL